MDPANDFSKTATCTTCRFKEDLSNYWTMVMYFKHPNGSFIRVPQIANENTGAPDGGMTIYYIEPRAPSQPRTVTTFPKGFRMRVGAPQSRVDTNPRLVHGSVNATTIRCWDGTGIGPGTPGTGRLDTRGFPMKRCEGGMRSQVYFPQCWDGKNLDSPDHESHVAHPIGPSVTSDGNLFFGTNCPATHPIRVPLLFMETVWDTRIFNDIGEWDAEKGVQPFVWSMGDPTGFGHHADYVFGWITSPETGISSLQLAMSDESCMTSFPGACDVLTAQNEAEMAKCRMGSTVPEVTENVYLPALPGCNPLQGGPAPATAVPDSECGAVTTTVARPVPVPTVW